MSAARAFRIADDDEPVSPPVHITTVLEQLFVAMAERANQSQPLGLTVAEAVNAIRKNHPDKENYIRDALEALGGSGKEPAIANIQLPGESEGLSERKPHII